ncbi:hypothetical protein CDAR_620911 [Caerostris darwini]|uniref:Uncharacterized protein n=1 Tax=Caerostris darwini TaxID=1538125 RepID=A0AAV4URE6_9ARAC|nr:hypothetical protein CDAR_620911 [Caerostris darwini]
MFFCTRSQSSFFGASWLNDRPEERKQGRRLVHGECLFEMDDGMEKKKSFYLKQCEVWQAESENSQGKEVSQPQTRWQHRRNRLPSPPLTHHCGSFTPRATAERADPSERRLCAERRDMMPPQLLTNRGLF